MSKTLPSELLGFVRQSADKEVLVGHEDLLDVVGIGHCCRERRSGRGVFYGLGEWAQDASWHPALGSRRVDVGWPVNQVHVLLVSGQDLDGLTLSDADLVFFECRVVFGDPHGGGDAVTAAVAVLGSGRKMEGGKRTKGREGEDQGERWRWHRERMGTIEDKVMVESRWAGSRPGRLQRRCSGPTPEEERREVVIEEEEKHKNNSLSVVWQFQTTAHLLHARCHHRHLNSVCQSTPFRFWRHLHLDLPGQEGESCPQHYYVIL